MNRIEFVQLITTDIHDISYTDMIIKFFDQHMILYDILDNVKYVQVIDIGKKFSCDYIIFNLTFKDIEEAKNNAEKINSIPYINIYGKQYHIVQDEINNCNITVEIDLVVPL